PGMQICVDGRWSSCLGGVVAVEEVCNGEDDDCNGAVDDGVGRTFYGDADGDGFGDSGATATACAAPAGYVAAGGDCDDARGGVHPGAPEVGNGIDDDCDGEVDE